MLCKSTPILFAITAYGAVHESLEALPFGWTQSSQIVSDDAHMQLQVALQYQNIGELEAKLASVSTPGSADYGKYLDVDELNALFAPSKYAESNVMAWLKKSGAVNLASDGTTISFTTTRGNANKMLDTSFDLYTNGETTKLRTTSYSIPDDLADAIDIITPTLYMEGTKAHRALPDFEASKTERLPEKRQLNPSCETSVPVQISANETKTYDLLSPTCLKELYNIGSYKSDPKSGSTVAFGSFLNQSASNSDLAKFEKMFNIPSQKLELLALINGGVDNQNPLTEEDGEANLDAQNIIGLVGGLPVGQYITGGSPPFIPDLLSPNQSVNQNEPYLQYYNYLLKQPNKKLPYVISNSYGDHERTVPEKYAKRVCNQIGMMGMRGRTIIESSGDEGVGAVCRDNVGSMKPEFTPQFPGTCPYVLTVGGTAFYNPEQAWNASSGGFSFYFKTASYQKEAVQTYLSKYISPATKKYYSSNKYVDFGGRGFPDVSAHSLYPDYLTVINGTSLPNGGASAAAPVVAAVIALLNDARFRANKPSMGFINPWLYKIAAGKALNDITTGGSLGCSGVDLQNGILIPKGGHIPYASWNATVGWDPVTGLGTPDFMKLKALALQDY